MSHLRVAYSFIGVASGYSYEVIMKLLEIYKPAHGTWVSIDHPSNKNKELNYWVKCGYKLPTLSVCPKDFNGPYKLTRIRKENQ